MCVCVCFSPKCFGLRRSKHPKTISSNDESGKNKKKKMFGQVFERAQFGKFGTPSIPVPDNSVRVHGGGIHPTEVVRYDLSTLPNTPAWFGTDSISVPDTSVSSVRPQHLYPTLR